MNDGMTDQQGAAQETATCVEMAEMREEADGLRIVCDGIPGGTETILFVEDEAFVREVTCEILQSAGYTVLPARGAADALAAFGEHRGEIELLLTDIVLPGETGRALARRLGQEKPQLKVLFVTGYAEQMAMRESGHAECLAKPFSTGVLLRKVRQLLDRRKVRTEKDDPLRRAGGNA